MPLIIEFPKCGICGVEYRDGEVVAGVRVGHEEAPDGTLVDPGQNYEGHYDCVTDALGAVEALRAINAGRLAPRNVAMEGAAGHRLPDGTLLRVAQPGPKPAA